MTDMNTSMVPSEDTVRWSDTEQCWQVRGLAEVIEAFRRADALSSVHNFGSRRLIPPRTVRRGSVMGLDPPAHSRVRAPARAAFTPRAVERLRVFCLEQVELLVGEALAARDGVDVVASLSHPLSQAVMCNVLSVEEEHRDVLGAVGLIAESFDSGQPSATLLEALGTTDRFVVAKLEEAESPDSVLGTLIDAHRDGALTLDELQDFVLALIAAGTHTTMHGVSHAIHLLATDPEAKQQLREGTLQVEPFVEEVLRYASPVQRMYRTAVAPIVLGGQEIQLGDFVCLMIGAANRDPHAFHEPNTFDLHREPGRTVSFGHGIHHCLGAAIARIEMSSAVAVMQRRVSEIDCGGPGAMAEGKIFRGYTSLPVKLVPRSLG